MATFINCSLVICGLVVIWFLYSCYKMILKYKRLEEISASIPANKGLPFIGQLLRYKNIDCLMDIAYHDFLKYKSPVKVFLGPFLGVIVADPENIQTILNSSSTLEKYFVYKFSDDFLYEGLITASNDRWKVTRKLLNPTFHQEILQNNIHTFLIHSTNLVQQLISEKDKGQIEISQIITKTVLDSVSQTMLGYEVNNDDVEIDFFRTMETFMLELTKRGLNPFLYPDFIYKLTKSKKIYSAAGKKLHAYLSQVIKFKREEIPMNESGSKSHSKRKNFITRLLEITQNNDIYDENQLLGEILSMFIAATNTTTLGICFVLVLLGIHEDIQERVYKEIVEILGDSSKPITYEDIQRMVYLESVIKEVMRLYPPVPFIMRHVATDLPIGKHKIPRGAMCVISPYLLHRNPDVWSDPEKFNPDRFFSEDIDKRHPYSYIPFAGGHRTCIGKGYAMLYIKSAVASILQTLVITCDLCEEDFKLSIDVSTKLKGGFNIGIRERNC